MSYLIKGGYDALRKQIVNISLRHTHKWTEGRILTNNIYICKLSSRYDNRIVMVKNNEKHALLLNNMIIYETANVFEYDIDLTCCLSDYKRGTASIDNLVDMNLIDYNYVNYNEITNLNAQRTLN